MQAMNNSNNGNGNGNGHKPPPLPPELSEQVKREVSDQLEILRKSRGIQGARRFSTEDVAKALRLANGRVHTASEFLGCGHNTLYAYIRENPELQELRQFLHEKRGDIAESMLDEAVKAKEAWAICF